MAWLEPAIYITTDSLHGVRMFADQAPFQELEPLPNKYMNDPVSMAACAKNQTIYINESVAEKIWKIQLSDKKWTKLNFPPGFVPRQLSVIPKNKLLVVFARLHYYSMEDGPFVLIDTDSPRDGQRSYFSIVLFQLETDRRKTFIPLPKYVEAVRCAIQLPDKNFVISHSNDLSSDEFFVSLVSFNDTGRSSERWTPSSSR